VVKLYLDPGHGGTDPGAIGNGLREKDIVLDICNRIKAGLAEYKDIDVLMSRTTDVFIPLTERTKQANLAGADVLLSVHINAAVNTAAKGFESFIYPSAGSATVAFQNVMHQEIMRATGNAFEDRGKKQKDLHMLRESLMKAVLTENGFISNAADSAKLNDPAFRQNIANGHIIGLERFLGLEKEIRPPTPTPNDKMWIVQVGAFNEKKNAEALAADLRKSGYRPFIKYE
jgi:N-acetylmuramoyl-L-alanine amidase